MNIFHKTCHCHLREVPFRSAADFDSHAVKAVYCNVCSKDIKTADVAVQVRGIPGWSGNFLIDWNEHYLEQHDPKFKKTAAYAKSLIEDDKVTLGFLPHRRSKKTMKISARR